MQGLRVHYHVLAVNFDLGWTRRQRQGATFMPAVALALVMCIIAFGLFDQTHIEIVEAPVLQVVGQRAIVDNFRQLLTQHTRVLFCLCVNPDVERFNVIEIIPFLRSVIDVKIPLITDSGGVELV
jgi:hypothetical protein